MIRSILHKSFSCLIAMSFLVNISYAQTAPAGAGPAPGGSEQPAGEIKDSLSASENVTLDFKDADIHNVLKILAKKADVNIVTTPDVIGTVTIKLVDVPWTRAMDVILKSNGFGYQKQGNVILVTKLENMSKIQADEPLKTEIVNLKFLDAQDAQRILIPMLTSRGKISILYTRGQKGWKFGTFRIGKDQVAAAMQEREGEGAARTETVAISKSADGNAVASKVEYEPSIKSKTLIITDTDANIDHLLSHVLPQIDRMPKQVLIEARIMEVNRDKLKDIGFDYGTGENGATSSTLTSVAVDRNSSTGDSKSTLAANSLSSQALPSTFSPKSSGINGLASNFNTGLNLLFKKLSGTQFEILAHALEEDVQANTLSAPRIVTLDNQEASMLVGYHTPILSSSVSAGSSTEGPTQTQTLDYYQEIGIRLNVVPQISEEGYINMIIHPSVTSSSSNVTATNVAGTGSSAIQTTINYPIIDVREAQTQILMRDGETIVIGGLLKDVTSKSVIGIPFLSKIPFLGALFRRDTIDTAKVDLLIFITAHVLTDEEFSAEEIGKLEERLNNPALAEKKARAEQKKNKKKSHK